MFSVLHSFVNLFAGGRSNVKVILFMVFLLSLFLSVIFFKKIKSIRLCFFVVPLVSLYIIGGFLHLFLLKMYHFTLGTFFITGNNNELSSSVISHTHEAKVFVGSLLQLIGNSNLSTIDAGGAYLGIFPDTIVFLGALLLLFVIIMGTLLINQFYLGSSTTRVGRNLFICWYAIVVFSLIKGAIDGGILSLIVPVVLLSIAFFLYIRKRIAPVILYGAIGTGLVGCMLVVIYPAASWAIIVMQAVSTFFLLGLLSLCITKTHPRIFTIFFCTLFLMSWWLASVRDRSLYSYGAIELHSGDSYNIFDRVSGSVEKRISQKAETINSIVKKEQVNLSYGPISIPGRTCFSHGIPSISTRTILTKKSFESIEDADLSIVKIRERFDGTWWRTDILITTSSCLPEPLSMFDAEMRRHGFDFYVMVEQQVYDDTIDR